jgi:hypothetical protein
MAQVKFYPMRIRFQKLRDLLDLYDGDEAHNFANLVFQNENPDAPQNRDEFDLTAFVVRSNGTVQDQILDAADLSRDPNNNPHRKNAQKVAFANYSLSRARIEGYRDGAGGNLIEYLILIPADYDRDPRYIKYIISARNANEPLVVGFTENELNPSPPADPAP